MKTSRFYINIIPITLLALWLIPVCVQAQKNTHKSHYDKDLQIVYEEIRKRNMQDNINIQAKLEYMFAKRLINDPKLNNPLATHQYKQNFLTTEQVAHTALPSIISITTKDIFGNIIATGSGIIVGAFAIVTNFHVIQDAQIITINFKNGSSVPVTHIANLDSTNDLVLLVADTRGFRPLPLEITRTPQLGEAVVAIGSPKGLSGSISTGIVSGLRKIEGTRVIQTTTPISSGCSGGALLDKHARVIGVTSFRILDAENLNFACSSKYVYRLIQDQPERAIPIKEWIQRTDR